MSYDLRKFRDAGKDVLSVREWAVRFVAAVLGIGFLYTELQRILRYAGRYSKVRSLLSIDCRYSPCISLVLGDREGT